MNDTTNFIHWYNDDFKRAIKYRSMQNTTENSPWHREHSVAVHTDMVVTQYLLASQRVSNPKSFMLGAFAAAFHDVGKPGAKTEKYSESRGNYYSFGGHESLSARMWENYFVSNYEYLNQQFDLNYWDGFVIGYLIEYHKPWDLKKEDKLNALATTLVVLDVVDVFVTLIMADTLGRISDDAEAKLVAVTEWCDELVSRCNNISYSGVSDDKPTMHVPIAPSGAGKSTLLTSRFQDSDVFSLDLLRHEWYDADDYARAFDMSCNDSQFNNKAFATFNRLLSGDRDLYLDNTNLSKKIRRKFINAARSRGYNVIAYLLPVMEHTVIQRQSTRQDKTVPVYAVKQQYNSLQLPNYGEFDEVYVVASGELWGR